MTTRYAFPLAFLALLVSCAPQPAPAPLIVPTEVAPATPTLSATLNAVGTTPNPVRTKPPEGLVYCTNYCSDWWKVDANGYSEILVQGLLTDGGAVVWSHSKDSLLYADNGDIWILNLQTRQRRNLTNSSGTDELDPMWSPNDQQIAFIQRSNSIPFSEDVWLMDLSSGQKRNLTTSVQRVERGFCCGIDIFEQILWSASDPNLLFFASDMPKTPSWGPREGDSDQFPTMVRVDGSDYRVIDPRNGSYFAPAVSPDGRYLAYDGGNFSTIGGFLYDLKTNKTINVKPSDYGIKDSGEYPLFDRLVSPRWSPDGKKIIWMAGRSDFKVAVILFDLSQKTAKVLDVYDPYFANATLPPGRAWPSDNFQWSPDGKWIFLITDSWDLYRGDLFHTGLLQLFDKNGVLLKEMFAADDAPVWSPDNRSLAFDYIEFSNKRQYEYDAIRTLNLETLQTAELDLPPLSRVVGWLP